MSVLTNFELDRHLTHEHPARELPYTPILTETQSRDTRNGHRAYELLCAGYADTAGNAYIIRKALLAHSDDPTDWLVMYFDASRNQLEDIPVYHSATKHDENGDAIILDIPTDQADRGPYKLIFRVTQLYQPDGSQLTKAHLSYYGRSYSPELNYTVDATYDVPIMDTVIEPKPVSIERRHMKDLGKTAAQEMAA